MSFVDFKNVWLAYNDELLAKQQFAVEEHRERRCRVGCVRPLVGSRHGVVEGDADDGQALRAEFFTETLPDRQVVATPSPG